MLNCGEPETIFGKMELPMRYMVTYFSLRARRIITADSSLGAAEQGLLSSWESGMLRVLKMTTVARLLEAKPLEEGGNTTVCTVCFGFLVFPTH